MTKARVSTARARARPLDARYIDRVIRANLDRLRKPGVLSVRPGFEIRRHRLTGRPAIVATVHTKRSPAPAGTALPDSIAGIAVDVREATAYQRLRARDPDAASVAQAYGPPQLAQPDWPFERLMPGGKLLAPRPGAARAPASAGALAQATLDARATKPQLPYTPPAGFPLQPVTVTTTLVASVSPDAGLATLTGFLQGTMASLVVGMYDFTSARILASFQQTLAPPARRLDLVLDNPAPNPTRDQTDTQTAAALGAALGARARIARALSRTDALASAWIFPSAYHIKVIVRDGSALWLSSGNLNNSNLPDPAQPPATQDRDWHVIVQDPALAGLFAAYLENDLAVASAHQAAAPAELQRTVDDARLKLAEDTRPAPPVPARPRVASRAAVAAKTFSAVTATITPLLTPDTVPGQPGTGAYQSRILALIASARTSLYLQMQYVETPAGDAAGGFKALLAAVLDRLRAGVDVRIIESLEYGEVWAEKMRSLPDVDLTPAIRLQADVHNKGIVVDSRIVVVSSQNWSAAGVLQNRDAGLIIDSAPVAQYYESVFLDDWQNRAKPFAPPATARAPAGRRRSPVPARR